MSAAALAMATQPTSPEPTKTEYWPWKKKCKPRTKPHEPEPEPPKNGLSDSEKLGLAIQSCVFCNGLGRRGEFGATCKCVYRAVFRQCLQAFRDTNLEQRQHVSQFVYELGIVNSRPNYRMYEWAADFLRVSRLALTGHELERHVFRLHMLHGFDHSVCCKRLGIDRGTFFHKVFWIQARLGRAFSELSPYALFPVGEYLQPPVKR